MAANTDKLKKYKSLFSTTLSTGIGTGTSDTITPATVTGLPTDTAITLTFDRVDSGAVATPTKLERITGVIAGGNLTSYVRGKDSTTEQAHSAGAVIEMVWNSQDWNDMVDWGLVEHNQDGTHEASFLVSSYISASAITASKIAASAVLPGNLAASAVVAGNIGASAIVAGNLAASSVSQGNLNFSLNSNADGWTAAGTFTYASADDPTYTITVASGAASIYNVGDRIKLTQSTGGTKYFIVTAVADTVLTVYGGTDYDLANEAITAPYYSHQKNPLGFPQSPAKWTIETSSSADDNQASPTNGTWYNAGSRSIIIPIGAWYTELSATMYTYDASGTAVGDVRCTLSTGNNSETDTNFSAVASVRTTTAALTLHQHNIYRNKLLELASKTTYYLNVGVNNITNIDNVGFAGNNATTYIRAICAYL